MKNEKLNSQTFLLDTVLAKMKKMRFTRLERQLMQSAKTQIKLLLRMPNHCFLLLYATQLTDFYLRLWINVLGFLQIFFEITQSFTENQQKMNIAITVKQT